MDGYYDLEENQETIKELADHEGLDPDTYADTARENRKTDFQSFTVDGDTNTITFYSGLNEEDEIFSAEYEFVGIFEGGGHHHDHDHDHDHGHDHHGHDHSMWYEFRAVGESEYPTLLLMDVHGEEVMAHFHMRYGNSADEIDEREEWFPTFIDPSTPMAQVQENL